MKTHWCVIPAAGRGSRFGGDTPKQYLQVAGRSILAHTLDALLSHPRVAGTMLVLPADDQSALDVGDCLHGKPLLRCVGGASRAESVGNGLDALPSDVGAEDIVLVHDAARPNIAHADLDALFAALDSHAHGAILAAPLRDTLKRADADGAIIATQPRDALWRAFTPQAFARGRLADALAAAKAHGVEVTDEAMAMELAGFQPRLVEGREGNFKITTPADLARFEFLLAQR